MSRNAKHRVSTLGALGLTLTIVGAGLFMSPASALDGMDAHPDNFFGVHNPPTETSVSGNVLANDEWDAAHTARVISVAPLPGSEDGYTFSWTPEGDITVDFGPDVAEHQIGNSAQLAYTAEDSAGQRDSAHITVHQDIPQDQTLTANDDVLVAVSGGGAIAIEDGSAFTFSEHVLGNDVFPSQNDKVRIEVVEQPGEGEVSIDNRWFTFTPLTAADADFGPSEQAPNDELVSYSYTDTYAVSFRYRLCIEDTCSEPATASMDYFQVRTNRVPQDGVTRTFWDGSADSFHVDISHAAVEARLHLAPGALTGTTPYVRVTREGPIDGEIAHEGAWPIDPGETPISGDTWIVARDDLGWYYGETWRTDSIDEIRWRDPTGAPVAVLKVTANTVAAPQAPAVADDEIWVAVGQNTGIPALLNDDNPVWTELVGALGYEGHGWIWTPYVLIDQAPSLTGGGGFATHHGDTEWARLTDTWVYHAGIVAGDDIIKYRLCHGYPTEAGCSTPATLTVHVSPLAEAEPDATPAEPGTAVDVRVLRNDTYTDTPTLDATVSLLDVPEGITATVNPDRTVKVTATESLRGQTVEFGYRLSDFTGSAEARVQVEVADAVVPPFDPPVLPVAPDAQDDATLAQPGDTAHVNVLNNDVFRDVPAVATVSTVDDAVVNDERWVLVTVPSDFEGDALTKEYTLCDEGGCDTATITVHVFRPEPPVVDPPVDPPVTPVTPPKARDDKAEATFSVPVAVRVLANDTFAGKAEVQIVKGSAGKGVNARVDAKNRVVVTAAKAHAGETVTVRYRLTDKSGKRDVATVRVKVAPALIIVTGGDRETPAEADTSMQSNTASLTPGGAWLALGFALLLLLGTRRLTRRFR